MELKSNTPNIRYGNALLNKRQNGELSPKNSNLSFKGGKEAILEDALSLGKKAAGKNGAEFSSLLSSLKSRAQQFIKRVFTEGTDKTYEYKKEAFEALHENFGSTFADYIDRINVYNEIASSTRKNGLISKIFKRVFSSQRPNKTAISLINDSNSNTITFHSDPFIKNVCEGIKEFTVGTALDCGIILRKHFRRLSAKVGGNEVIASTARGQGFLNRILDKRIAEKSAKDAYYKISGAFEQMFEGVIDSSARSKLVNPSNVESDTLKAIGDNAKNIAKTSIESACKKVGKYNTKTERAWNRLGTGFISALFASTDFYNISMLQNNDPEKANASGRKRFMQDMRRQGLTAGITYVILGALQSKVNKSMLYAVLSLGGVTLISEILSRKMGKIPLTPLTPEAAAKLSDKKEKTKGNEKPEVQENVKEQETKSIFPETMKLSPKFGEIKNNKQELSNEDVFSIFTKQIDDKYKDNAPSFKSNGEDKEKNVKKKSSFVTKIPAILFGLVGLSLAVGFLRTRNIFNLDTNIKAMGAKYNDFVEKLTRKRLVLPKKQVDGLMDFMDKSGFKVQHDALAGALDGIKKSSGPSGVLTGQSSIVQKALPLREIDPNGLYYDFGYVESRGRKTVMNVLLYPINALSKLFKGGNNLCKKLFTGGEEQINETGELSRKTATEFIQKYSGKHQTALNTNSLSAFKDEMQDALTRNLSEANSKNKNTTLAMISRFLITFISGYFFVNDYRNEVLIESKGKDVERANATAKERIGHKISNFFLNTMFMDIFNTTFEHTYLGSVAGATAVAMATEFTNETAVRASICTPTMKMSREELIEYEDKRLNDKGIKGKYYRAFMKLTGKKPLSEKAKKK